MAREVSESSYEYLLAEMLSINKLYSDDEDHASKRVEHMGYEIGFRYIEKILPQSKFIGNEPLDIVKFLCKEFWEELFKKKVLFNFTKI